MKNSKQRSTWLKLYLFFFLLAERQTKEGDLEMIERAESQITCSTKFQLHEQKSLR
jgi:hypothetical protein